jgi:hypothetical protein
MFRKPGYLAHYSKENLPEEFLFLEILTATASEGAVSAASGSEDGSAALTVVDSSSALMIGGDSKLCA